VAKKSVSADKKNTEKEIKRMSASGTRASATFPTLAVTRNATCQQDHVIKRAFIFLLHVAQAFIQLLRVDRIRELTPGHGIVFESPVSFGSVADVDTLHVNNLEELTPGHGVEVHSVLEAKDGLMADTISVNNVFEFTPGHGVEIQSLLEAKEGIKTTSVETKDLKVDNVSEFTTGHDVIFESKVQLLRNNSLVGYFTAGESITAGDNVSVLGLNTVYKGYNEPTNTQEITNPNQLADHNRMVMIQENVFLIVGTEQPTDRSVQTGYVQVVRWRPDLQTFEVDSTTAPAPGPGAKVRLPTQNSGTTPLPDRVTDAVAITIISSTDFAIAYCDMSGSGGGGAIANIPRCLIGRITPRVAPPGFNITLNTITTPTNTANTNGNLNTGLNTAIPNARQIRIEFIDQIGSIVRLLVSWRSNTDTTVNWQALTYDLSTFPAFPPGGNFGAKVSTAANGQNAAGFLSLNVLDTAGNFVSFYTNANVSTGAIPSLRPAQFVSRVGEVTGTVVTVGAEQQIQLGAGVVVNNAQEHLTSARISSTRIGLAWMDDFNYGQGAMALFDIDTVAKTTTLATPIQYWYPGFQAGVTPYQLVVVSATRYLLVWAENPNGTRGRTMVIDFSGGSLTFHPFQSFAVQNTQSIAAVRNSSDDFFIIYRPNTDLKAHIKYINGFLPSDTTLLNYSRNKGERPIGVAQQNAIAGEQVRVVLAGISEAHTGLIPLQDYYTHADGTNLQNAVNQRTIAVAPVRLGSALDSTRLYVGRVG
jgi:hypothetical protein